MARIRTIKPKFFTNEDLAALPFEWRLLFIGLWTQADRDGRLEDRPKRLKAELFPYDDLDVNAGLGCLTNAGFLTRYDVNGLRLIAINTWHKHQQPHVKEADSELPPPPDREHRASTLLAPQEGKGTDQGKEQERSTSAARRARFERFWAAYPRKVAKDAALRVWERLDPNEELTAVMIAEVARQTVSEQWREERFIPHARTWLNQGRWKDEPPQPAPHSDADRSRRSREVGRLMREEGLTMAQASLRMGF